MGDRVKINGDLSLETGLPFLAAVDERMDQLFRRDQAVSEANPLECRGCAVPGCDRLPSQCDAHHVQFWEDHGTTGINDLVLLCRHHHRMIHADRLSVDIIDGVPYFYDPFDRLLRSGRHRPWVVAA